jgi:hypothetical protein
MSLAAFDRSRRFNSRPGRLWGTLVICAVVLVPRPLLGCSCGHRPYEEVFSGANAVFRGKVHSVSHRYLRHAWLALRSLVGASPDDPTVDYGLEVTFEVMEAWKGTKTKSATAVTGWGGGDCGVDYREGEEFVVFAFAGKKEGASELSTGICSTKRVSNAAGELSFLRALPGLPTNRDAVHP